MPIDLITYERSHLIEVGNCVEIERLKILAYSKFKRYKESFHFHFVWNK